MNIAQLIILLLILGIPSIVMIVDCVKTTRAENERLQSVVPGSVWEYKNRFTDDRYKDPFSTEPIVVRKILERKTNDFGIDFVKYVNGHMLNGQEVMFDEDDIESNTVCKFLKVHELMEKK